MTDENVHSGEGSQNTSSSLLERLRGNDEQAWGRLVHLYTPLVYTWCRQAGLQEADAADVGQEVFRAVARSIADYRHDREGDTFRGWLRTITVNKLRDFARQLREGSRGVGGSDVQQQLLQIPEEDPAATDASAIQEDTVLLQRRAIEMILAEFEEQSRKAFLRVVVEEQTPAEVAQELGMTVNAVYLAKSRILRRLREEFDGLLE